MKICGRGFESHVDVCVYSAFVLPCVQVAALRQPDQCPRSLIGRTADFGRWISVAQWSDARMVSMLSDTILP
jgi:hypothetical protein